MDKDKDDMQQQFDLGLTPDPSEEQEESGDDPVAALQARMDQLTSDAAEREQRLMEVIETSFLPQQQQSTTPQLPALPEIHLDDLPDPVDSADEFKKQLAVRVGDFVKKSDEARVASTSVVNDQEARLNALWAQYEAKSSDLSEMVGGDAAMIKALGEDEVNKEISAVRARGIDPAAFVIAQGDRFVDKIHDSVKARLDKLGIGDNSSEEEEDEDTNRTGGLPSSKSASNSHRKSGKTESSGTLTDEMKEFQRNSGFF